MKLPYLVQLNLGNCNLYRLYSSLLVQSKPNTNFMEISKLFMAVGKEKGDSSSCMVGANPCF